MPAAQSMMTHRVNEREQGELQGAIQSMRSITFIIGPVLFSQVFSWFIDPKHPVHVPGAPYFLAAALLFAAMLMSTRIRQEQPESATTATEVATSFSPPEVTATGAAPLSDSKESI
jgi:DHA1 family tetracycline resistance protein-like MFS transporter